jgi:prevent-host-death family protein
MAPSHTCYDRRVATVPSRDLRNRTRQVLDRVEAGEDVTITVDGRPLARLTRVSSKQRWISRDLLFEQLQRIQADPGLADDLAALAPDTTDDLEPL